MKNLFHFDSNTGESKYLYFAGGETPSGEIPSEKFANLERISWVKEQLTGLKNEIGSYENINKTKIIQLLQEVKDKTWKTNSPAESAKYVFALQSALHLLGHGDKVGKIDALWGGKNSNSSAGLWAFQEEWNTGHPDDTIGKDGVPGPGSIRRILKALDASEVEAIVDNKPPQSEAPKGTPPALKEDSEHQAPTGEVLPVDGETVEGGDEEEVAETPLEAPTNLVVKIPDSVDENLKFTWDANVPEGGTTGLDIMDWKTGKWVRWSTSAGKSNDINYLAEIGLKTSEKNVSETGEIKFRMVVVNKEGNLSSNYAMESANVGADLLRQLKGENIQNGEIQEDLDEDDSFEADGFPDPETIEFGRKTTGEAYSEEEKQRAKDHFETERLSVKLVNEKLDTFLQWSQTKGYKFSDGDIALFRQELQKERDSQKTHALDLAKSYKEGANVKMNGRGNMSLQETADMKADAILSTVGGAIKSDNLKKAFSDWKRKVAFDKLG